MYDTISQNITMGHEGISDKDVENVIKLVGLDKFVEQLPMGLNTYLYENGRNLSGGQKQKIAIARALVRIPEILILDETLSQIEEDHRKKILCNIFEKNPDMTCILICHDRQVSALCDREINLSGE